MLLEVVAAGMLWCGAMELSMDELDEVEDLEPIMEMHGILEDDSIPSEPGSVLLIAP